MLATVSRIAQIGFLVVATAAVGWFLYGQITAERPRELTPYERPLVERVVAKVVEELPRDERIRRLLVMPVKHDLDGRVTDVLVDRLGREREEYDVIDARSYLGKGAPSDAKAALEVVEALKKDARPDGFLFPTVERTLPRDGVGTSVALELRLVPNEKKEDTVLDRARRVAAFLFPEADPAHDVAEIPGQEVSAQEKIESRFSMDWFAPTMHGQSSLVRFAIWLVLVAGLPFALSPVVTEVVRRENNRLNAALLAGFSAFNLLLALTLMGFRPGVSGWLLALVGTFFGFLYDFVMCDRIDEARKG
jgi:hypothetical protein